MVDFLSLKLRSQCFLPIRRYEMQMAFYQKDQFYSRHVDRHKNGSGRLISMVFYFNQWEESHEGELVIYQQDKILAKLPSMGNAMSLFLSELEHEVLTSQTDRKSITVWFRDDLL